MLLLFAMFSLGSWPFLLHLASHKGRVRSHAYLDYCLAFYGVAIICALTLGQLSAPAPSTPNFIQQLRDANFPVAGMCQTFEALVRSFSANLCVDCV